MSTRAVAQQLLLLIVIAAASVWLAYQVRPTLRLDVGGDNESYLTGFYYSQSEPEHNYRWSRDRATVRFPDVGKSPGLLLTMSTNAWRQDARIYTATVTLNGAVVGEISRAGWRTWRFAVSDSAILRADHAIVGIQANTFVPSDLYPDIQDERRLGLAVEYVEITPQIAAGGGWLDNFIVPPLAPVLFAMAMVSGIYAFGLLFDLSGRKSFTLALILAIAYATTIAFFRIASSDRYPVLALAVGVVAVAGVWSRIVRPKEARADRQRARRILSIVIPCSIALLAFALRWNAIPMLPVEGDDAIYMGVAEHYAQAMSMGNWRDVVQYDGETGHPPFYELVFASSLVLRDRLGIAADNTQTMRVVAALLGTAQAVVIALLNPLAGWFVAIQTTEIKFTSMAYLEALPALSIAVSVIAFERFRRKANTRWLYISAIALGVTAASKFIYLAGGFAIAFFLLWEQRTHARRIITYGVIAFAVFILASPYFWTDPIGRLQGMFSFHSAFSQREFVRELNRPWWTLWFTLAQPGMIYSPAYEHPPFYVIVWDLPIYILGLLGLPSLARRSGLYLAWFLAGMVFLALWSAKWEQYAMIVAAPLCLSAGYFVSDAIRWLRALWISKRGAVLEATPAP